MAEANAEIVEPLKSNKPRLLYHGSTRAEAATFIAEHGLLADKDTLTPVLELAMDYARGGETLTFWYPKRSEHSQIGSLGPTQPTTPVLEDQRTEIKEKIAQSPLEEEVKQSYLWIVDRARTILPNTRLGAIVTPGTSEWARLSAYTYSSRAEDYLKKYVANSEAMVNQREELLNKAKNIIFVDGNLNIRQLAEDMIRTEVEHYLLHIGYTIRSAKNVAKYQEGAKDPSLQYELEGYLGQLLSVQFQEPAYERYRTMLISSINAFL
jgi:hypothetical protein